MKRYLLFVFAFMALSVRSQEIENVASVDSLFAEPYLNVLIHEALENNSDVRVAALNIEQSEAMLRSARLCYLPSFALAPNGSLSKVQEESLTKVYSLPLAMEWELSLGGRQKGEKQMARATWMQTQEQLKWMQVQVIAEVCNAYYTLVMLDRQYDITKQSVENQESAIETIRAFREVGRMDDLAVNQAEAALHATMISLTDLSLQRKKVETALSLLLNRSADTVGIERSVWGATLSIGMNPAMPIALQQLSSRPDVRGAEYALAAACGNEKVTKAAFYPTLRISADGGWTNNLGEIVNPGKLLINLIGGLTQPLFSQGTIRAQKDVADAQLKQAEIAFEKALLTAGSEVKDAMDECNAVRKKIEMRTLQIESSRKAWQNCQELLRFSQSVTYLDVLNAEASFLSAQLQESADWLEQQQALINLFKALCPLTLKTE